MMTRTDIEASIHTLEANVRSHPEHAPMLAERRAQLAALDVDDRGVEPAPAQPAPVGLVALAVAPSTAPEQPEATPAPAPPAPVEAPQAREPAPFAAPTGPETPTMTHARLYGEWRIALTATHSDKTPALADWANSPIPAADYAQFFGGPNPARPAAILGALSRGLCDIDLDSNESRALACELPFLTCGLAAFGRAGQPPGHYVATCKEALEQKDCRTVQFSLPASIKDKIKIPDEHGLMFAEARGNGGYTVLPNGEDIVWENMMGRTIPEMSWAELRRRSGVLAFLGFAVRQYPSIGERNNFSLALHGTLVRAVRSYYGEDESALVDHVDRMVLAVCRLAGDQGHGPSWEKRAAATWAKIKAGAPASGLPKLLEILGVPELEKTLRKWLGAEADDRPIIEYEETHLTAVLDKVEDAIIQACVPIYQMAGRVVRAIRFDNPKGNALDKKGRALDQFGIRRPIGALQIHDVKKHRLLEYFVNTVSFTKINAKGKTVRANPPMSLIDHYLAREGEWQVPVLRGIVEAPTLRADGTLLCIEGYDEASGLLVDFGGVTYPPIPDRPTKDEALTSLAFLKVPLVGFPFVPDDEGAEPGPNTPSASRSVVLSGIMTPIVRPSIRTSPLHAHTAPAAGTGKSLLVDVESIVATGKVAAAMAQGGDEVEDEKRLGGVLMQGDIMTNIDNITRPLGGAMLCQVLTQESVQIRVLGFTGQRTLPSRTFLTCTGNNLVLLEDVTRRAIICRLDARVEQPETRKFDGDLKAQVQRQRPLLVAAALIIMRAFIIAGRPGATDLEPFGGFEDWSNLVRGALVWLGEPDPCATREGITKADPVRSELAALIAAVRDGEGFGLGVGKPFKSQHLIVLGGDPSHTELKSALDGLFPRGAMAKGLTAYLCKHADRIVGGHAFRAIYDKHEAAWFFILRAESAAQGELL